MPGEASGPSTRRPGGQFRGGHLVLLHRHQGNSNNNQRSLEGDPRMPKKAADNMFQIQDLILAPELQCFVIE